MKAPRTPPVPAPSPSRRLLQPTARFPPCCNTCPSKHTSSFELHSGLTLWPAARRCGASTTPSGSSGAQRHFRCTCIPAGSGACPPLLSAWTLSRARQHGPLFGQNGLQGGCAGVGTTAAAVSTVSGTGSGAAVAKAASAMVVKARNRMCGWVGESPLDEALRTFITCVTRSLGQRSLAWLLGAGYACTAYMTRDSRSVLSSRRAGYEGALVPHVR